MDLYPDQVRDINALIDQWLKHPEQELEATFGKGGVVDSTTFLAISQRLRSKGFEAMPQDDRISIITPNSIRLSLQGLGVIQQYCQDDKLENKPFTAMIKDRASPNARDSTIDIEEYNTRIKSRREITLTRDDPRIVEILQGWDKQKKAIRLVRRWTFMGNGMRIDMSMVRSTPKDRNGQFKWVTSFLEHNIFKEVPIYEVEVELLRSEETATLDRARKVLIGGIGEILRAIQRNTILIRNTIKKRVLDEYNDLLNYKGDPKNENRFRGVAPVTLEIENMTAAIDQANLNDNIRNGFNVTDKADGLRAMGFCDSRGDFYLIDMTMNVYRTGIRTKNELCKNTLLDGEWVTKFKDGRATNQFLIFDAYYSGDEDISAMPFELVGNNDQDRKTRYNFMNRWYANWRKEGQEELIAKAGVTVDNCLLIGVKKFMFGTKETSDQKSTIFEACNSILNESRPYYTDGLILTPNELPLPVNPGATYEHQFKWKPSEDNSIDFMVVYERVPGLPNVDNVTTGIHPESGETLRYKTMRLYVGSSRDKLETDPRNTILNELLPSDGRIVKKRGNVYGPILFNPKDYEDTMASTTYRGVSTDPETGEEYVLTDDSNEPIPDGSIVEMRYEPLRDPGWRWIPMRIRHDKTERLLTTGKYERTLNSEKVANSVWNSIHEPVTESMIRTGSEEPTEEEMKRIVTDKLKTYYNRSASQADLNLVRGMRDFHNKYIKDRILYEPIMKGGRKKVMDFACGRAGDLHKWINGNAGFVFGVDYAGKNITAEDGAYGRYMNAFMQKKGRVPLMAFAIGDSSLNIRSGEAGSTPEEKDIMRAVFGQSTAGNIPPYIANKCAGIMTGGADVGVCMFALHYFFKSIDTLNGFLTNLSETIAEGGYFAGCCFDGQRLFDLLRPLENGEKKIGYEGQSILWTITKKYDATELIDTDESVGLQVDVNFITIGEEYPEYLVCFDYFAKRMRQIGFDYMTPEECAEIGLRNSTNMFETSYDMDIGNKRYVMPDSIKQFSFLNRWFIFKRRSKTNLDSAVEEEAVPVPSVPSATVEPRVFGLEESKEEEAEDENEERKEEMPAIVEERGEVEDPTAKCKFTISRDVLPANIIRFADPDMQVAGESIMPGDDEARHDVKKPSRWLAPFAPFPINDPEEPTQQYPSMEHYINAMMIKYASPKPGDAATLMGSKGTIHMESLVQRGKAGERKDKPLEPKLLYQQLQLEFIKMKDAMKAMRIDTARWNTIKYKYYREAIKQRIENDARFNKILELAKANGKVLLYLGDAKSVGEMKGVYDIKTKRIIGENAVGCLIMEMAGFA